MTCMKCQSKSVVQARLILFSGVSYDVIFCQACEHVTRIKDSRPAAAYKSKQRRFGLVNPNRKGGDK